MFSQKEFKNLLSTQRQNILPQPFDLAYKSYYDLGFDKRDSEWFASNASNFVTSMRTACWTSFLAFEKDLTISIIDSLIKESDYSKSTPQNAIKEFILENSDFIYDLTLSHTQSRRARAGKEFESILELLFASAGIPFETQGSIGEGFTNQTRIGKMVDFISPGALHYLKDKRHTTLISCKTTLRERWQQVVEEIFRSGAREIYLATLDEKIATPTIKQLESANIIIVTTKENKETLYSNLNVMSFEELLIMLKDQAFWWTPNQFNQEELAELYTKLETSITHNQDREFLCRYYSLQLENLPPQA